MRRIDGSFEPNSVPLLGRIICVIWIISAIFFCLAELAIGYTFTPGGYLLSGFATILFVIGTYLLTLPALLMLIDHYDKRDNEADYRYFKKACLLTGLFFISIAPLSEFWMQLYPESVQSLLKNVHGFSEH